MGRGGGIYMILDGLKGVFESYIMALHWKKCHTRQYKKIDTYQHNLVDNHNFTSIT